MADETETPAAAEPSGVEKMVADAVADLKGFCDSIRADFDALKGRMDAADARRGDAEELSEGETADIPAGEGAEVVHPPVEIIEEPEAAEDADIEAAVPRELAADDIPDMESIADSVAARATAPLRADIERLARMMPAELSIEQRQAFAAAQEQAEAAFQSFGDHAPAPMQGESIGTYKRRLAAKMQPHSEKWKGTKLTAIADDATLDVIVGDIYNDAAAVARRGADVTPGMLMPVSRRTPAGHTVIEYRGSPGAWMRPLAGATRRATGKFNTGRN